MTTVHRFLVSGTNEQLATFQILVCMLWNGIERRGQTIFYTALDENKEFCLQHAKDLGLTVQKPAKSPRHSIQANPWKTIIQGDHPGYEWTAPDKGKEPPQCQ